MNIIRRLVILIALALLVIAGTGYAEDPTASPSTYFNLLPRQNPFEVPAQNTKLSLELPFGDRREVVYVPMKACVLTGPSSNWFVDKETRVYFAGNCGGVPETAEHLFIRVTAIGVNIQDYGWDFPGAGFYTTTPNSASTETGTLYGGWVQAIVFVQRAGQVETGAAIVELKLFQASGFAMRKGFELELKYGEAYAIVEVVGYTLPKTAKSTGLSWKGVRLPHMKYAVNDLVTDEKGLRVCVGANEDGCTIWETMVPMKY